MSEAATKLALTQAETIPLNKLVIHDGNVRQIKAGVSIESLAADIERRGLLQSLSVRPILADNGEETGIYGVQAGGRRLRALQLLAKQKKLAKNAPVPCIVRKEGFVEADSLAENTEREALHPLDQFRAFTALRDKGEGEETIAAAFGVTPAVVKQRLRLAKACPLLLQAYEKDELTLEQLMAFCITEDQERQAQVWDTVKNGWNNHPDTIRRMLTEKTVRASDRRAVFLGMEAYQQAGGSILRDLFDEDDSGYWQDVPLLEKLVAEKLQHEAEAIKAEGWAWVEAAIDFPWNHSRDYRCLKAVSPALTSEQEEELEALTAELEELESVPDNEIGAKDKKRLDKVKRLISHLESFQPVYDAGDMAKAGVFVSLDHDGTLFIDRGYVRREDEVESYNTGDESALSEDHSEGFSAPAMPSEEDEDGDIDLPDRLKTELTAFRSLALRDALANKHELAYLAVLHVLTLGLFYRFDSESCLQIEASDRLTSPFPGLADFAAARAIDARHKAWAESLPEDEGDLWDALAALDNGNREALFAHCAGFTVNAVQEAHNRTAPKRHANRLATALGLDMTESGWTTRADNYLNRITKAQIIAAVREAKGDEASERLSSLKKKEMALEAQHLLEDTGWLPELLRTPGTALQPPADASPVFPEEDMLQAAE